MREKFLSALLIFSFFASVLPCAWAQKNNSLANTTNKETIVKIEGVINSATLRLRDGRKAKLIGLIPLEKPARKELPRNEYNIIIEQDDPVITLEQTALDFITDLVEGKEIRFETDNLYRDSDGYILGYVFLKDGTFVNAEILRRGFSDLHLTPQNTKYEKELREAYLEAKKEKRGLQGN